MDESSRTSAEPQTTHHSPWQLLLGLVLGIATAANPFGAYYWGYSFVPALLLGFVLYLFNRTRTVAVGAFAAALGLIAFVVTALVLLLVMGPMN
ncbi:hypothetical protein [Mycobacteroides abscessus]|uniref:hypothetical protein n=1 Tax=Mycobacteroides abscessus TaxID=36809 RepID=UPI0009271164|nr:hypothetical protein [Mycobacteroides abscessus]MBE5462784.1 hypothetical protein [Mycobacteroides abscessus]QOF41035.1 hypothetical protein E3G69_000044 [Mycobacteroides abscessus]QOF45735.1 hypothetical protein E3G70_000044 [Mycobacteroides abscessus]SIJ32940.1 Uncharacterised protein [Mycobacteroides abscessus subsp. bolletii]